jgi:hypothetical protein
MNDFLGALVGLALGLFIFGVGVLAGRLYLGRGDQGEMMVRDPDAVPFHRRFLGQGAKEAKEAVPQVLDDTYEYELEQQQLERQRGDAVE